MTGCAAHTTLLPRPCLTSTEGDTSLPSASQPFRRSLSELTSQTMQHQISSQSAEHIT
jgi:hypothetical protein